MFASLVSFHGRKLLLKMLLSLWTETRLGASNRPLFLLPRSCSHGWLSALPHLLARFSACAPSQPASPAFPNVSGREPLPPAKRAGEGILRLAEQQAHTIDKGHGRVEIRS